MKSEGDEDDRRRELHGELLRRVRSDQIVVDAEADDQRAAGEQGEEIRDVLRHEARGLGVRGQQQERKAEAEDDGDPAEARRRDFMDLAMTWQVDQPDVLSSAPDDRGGDVGRQRTAAEEQQEGQVDVGHRPGGRITALGWQLSARRRTGSPDG